MKTTHQVLFGNSNKISTIKSNTIDLVITSPPYPMIEMWDEIFSKQNSDITKALNEKNGRLAFNLIHKELDKVWNELYRLLKDGGIVCINIGDATRTINGYFQLYANHARILQHCLDIGFYNLPAIIWRKQTNAPNKFMGSGMLPAGAYVTLEHEFILIMRKGYRREFKTKEDSFKRSQSSFFWEERNNWFSDVWMDLKGASQKINGENIRGCSAAYPFELAYRLINMFSCKGDIVLDPYLGTGTTTLAAMASARNSIGIEIDPNFKDTIIARINNIFIGANAYMRDRLQRHVEFVMERTKTRGSLKHKNKPYGFPVMTRQEVDLIINDLKEIKQINDNYYEVLYSEEPQEDFSKCPLFDNYKLCENKRNKNSKSLQNTIVANDLFHSIKNQS